MNPEEEYQIKKNEVKGLGYRIVITNNNGYLYDICSPDKIIKIPQNKNDSKLTKILDEVLEELKNSNINILQFW